MERHPKSFDVLTDETAREVHKRLFGNVWDWAGMYRLTEKNIGVPVWQISTEMRMCLDDARYWRENGTYDLLEATARLIASWYGSTLSPTATAVGHEFSRMRSWSRSTRIFFLTGPAAGH